MSALATLRLPRRQRRPAVGVCRVCGCTPEKACVETHGEPGAYSTCSWVESDLCSRCQHPGRPTRRQVGELGRIREFCGPLLVRPGQHPGWLTVLLDERYELHMDPLGAVVGRSVIPQPVVEAAF